MASNLRRTDDLQRLKTRELVIQQTDGSYAVANSVPRFGTATGNITSSNVTIDTSDNIVVPGETTTAQLTAVNGNINLLNANYRVERSGNNLLWISPAGTTVLNAPTVVDSNIIAESLTVSNGTINLPTADYRLDNSGNDLLWISPAGTTVLNAPTVVDSNIIAASLTVSNGTINLPNAEYRLDNSGNDLLWISPAGTTVLNAQGFDLAQGDTTVTLLDVSSTTLEIITAFNSLLTLIASKNILFTIATLTPLLTTTSTYTTLTVSWYPSIPITDILDLYLNNIPTGVPYDASGSTTFTGLEPGVSYTVRGKYRTNNGTSSTITGDTLAIPGTGFTAFAASATTIVVNWDLSPSNEITSVEIYYKISNAGTYTLFGTQSTDVSSATISSLLSDTAYSVYVRYLVGEYTGTDEAEPVQTPSLPLPVPSAPTIAFPILSGVVDIFWDRMADAVSYTLYIDNVIDISGLADDRFSKAELLSGQHSIQIAAVYPDKEEGPRSPATQITIPVSPTVIYNELTRDLDISWNANSISLLYINGVQEDYRIFSEQTTYTKRLLPSGQYRIQVAELIGSSVGPRSPATLITISIPKPLEPTVTYNLMGTSEGIIIIFVGEVSDASSYTLYINDVVDISGSAYNEFSKGDLSSGNYKIQVSAVNSSGEGPLSSATVITIPIRKPRPTTSVAVTNLYKTGFTVSWNPVDTATYYTVYVAILRLSERRRYDISGTSTSYDVSGLPAPTYDIYDMRYFVRVSASNTAGESAIITNPDQIVISYMPLALPYYPSEIEIPPHNSSDLIIIEAGEYDISQLDTKYNLVDISTLNNRNTIRGNIYNVTLQRSRELIAFCILPPSESYYGLENNRFYFIIDAIVNTQRLFTAFSTNSQRTIAYAKFTLEMNSNGDYAVVECLTRAADDLRVLASRTLPFEYNS